MDLEKDLEEREATEIAAKYSMSRLEQENAGFKGHNKWLEEQVFFLAFYLFIYFFWLLFIYFFNFLF